MNSNFLLSKDSSNEDLKIYFKRIFELEKSGEEFPVDLDEVWMLVYSRKDPAIRALREKFIQSIDYQVFHQNVENSSGRKSIQKYKLSVPCLEFFIARKIRPVFEVYRRATHEYRRRLAEQHQNIYHEDEMLDAMEMKVKLLRKHHERIEKIEHKITVMNAKMTTRPDQFTVAGFATLIGKSLGLKKAAKIGKKATAICKKTGQKIEKTGDPRFGRVNVYPQEVLLQLFQEIFGNEISVPAELI